MPYFFDSNATTTGRTSARRFPRAAELPEAPNPQPCLLLEPRILLNAGTLHLTNSSNYNIPDDGVAGGQVSSTITTSGAPSNATVTSVDVHYKVMHPYVGDLKAWLTTQQGSTWYDRTVWNREGGSADNIDEAEANLTTWNGLAANRTWYLAVDDQAAGDSGYIDYFEIWVNWSTPDPFNPSFYDARITNKVDQDSDGYARSFDVEWDVDSNIAGSYYVKVYEDDVAYDDYLLTSPTWSVNGSATDYHGVTINSDTEAWSHGTVELKLDLYDAATGQLKQTWTASNDANLGGINVELASQDTVFAPGFYDASLEGVTDIDGDGKYRSLRVGFDVDSNIAGQFYVTVYDNDIVTFDDLITTSPTYVVAGSASDWHYITFDVTETWFEWSWADTANIYLELWNANTNGYVATWDVIV
ncbi:MAG: proprotein convertase P-domain-containing protein [Phycisphaeraceae bacterium]